MIGNPDHPLCICPLGHLGPRCYIENEACKSSPCGENSSCYALYDPSGEESFLCVCSEQFYGDRCQYEKLIIQIRLNMTIAVAATATNFQFYGFVGATHVLILFHQEIMRGLPKEIIYNHGQEKIPPIGVLKIYEKLLDPRYFLLYVQSTNQQSINLTIRPEECPHASTLLLDNGIVFRTSPGKHHRSFLF